MFRGSYIYNNIFTVTYYLGNFDCLATKFNLGSLQTCHQKCPRTSKLIYYLRIPFFLQSNVKDGMCFIYFRSCI